MPALFRFNELAAPVVAGDDREELVRQTRTRCLLVCLQRRRLAGKEEVQHERLAVKRALSPRPASRGGSPQNHQYRGSERWRVQPANFRQPGRHVRVATVMGSRHGFFASFVRPLAAFRAQSRRVGDALPTRDVGAARPGPRRRRGRGRNAPRRCRARRPSQGASNPSHLLPRCWRRAGEPRIVHPALRASGVELGPYQRGGERSGDEVRSLFRNLLPRSPDREESAREYVRAPDDLGAQRSSELGAQRSRAWPR